MGPNPTGAMGWVGEAISRPMGWRLGSASRATIERAGCRPGAKAWPTSTTSARGFMGTRSQGVPMSCRGKESPPRVKREVGSVAFSAHST
jgi:hypothetical protein